MVISQRTIITRLACFNYVGVLSIFLNIQGRSLNAPSLLNGRTAMDDFCHV